ncbi:MAG: hypothetical protein QHH17_05420 [Candidatus Bathyarchaeota archaeon]|jgi:hypothetical protein|nr:hypothetical protein [Candidatus Bathyarchaeota archaeon]
MEINADGKTLMIQNDKLVVISESLKEEYNLSELVNVGLKRKFSRPLLGLAIISAIISLFNSENPFYLILTLVIFISAIFLREEKIILVFKEKTFVIRRLEKNKRKEFLEHLKSYLGKVS